MSEQSGNISIFNIGAHQEEMNSQMFKGGYETKLFDPKLANVQDSLTFIARPVPYIHNPLSGSLIQRAYYVLPDPAGNNVYFDSMTTFNKPAERKYEFCPVSDLWSKLRNSKDPAVQKRADFLRLQRANYAYLLIVNFPKDPAMNGKIVPMRLPVELIKAFDKMANPSKDDVALGSKPTQPFDIINGCNIKLEVTGKMVHNTLMRDWSVKVQESSVLQLPIGANGAMVAVNAVDGKLVEAYFAEQQTEDLMEVYGYKEPTIDTKRRMKGILMQLVHDVPGLPQVVNEYFPELNLHTEVDQEVAGGIQMDVTAQAGFMQPTAQPIAAQPAAPAPEVQPAAPEVQQGPAQPAAQPAPEVQQGPAAPAAQPAPEVQQGPAAQPAPEVQQGPAQPQNIGGIVIP